MTLRTNKNFKPKTPLHLLPFDAAKRIPKVILSVGDTLLIDKYATAFGLCHCLKNEGKKVAFIRLTGTNNPLLLQKACENGADCALDFADVGYLNTQFLPYEALLDIFQTLIDCAVRAVCPEYIIMDIGTDLKDKQTSRLLSDMLFTDTVHNVIYSCGEGEGILTDWALLNNWGCLPFAVVSKSSCNKGIINKIKKDVPVISYKEVWNGKALAILRGGFQGTKMAICSDKIEILNITNTLYDHFGKRKMSL